MPRRSSECSASAASPASARYGEVVPDHRAVHRSRVEYVPRRRQRDARPPGSGRQRNGSARQREAAKRATATGAIAAGVALASGWPENGSVCGATSSPTRAARGVLVAPVDRREQRARLLAVADHDLEHAGAVRRRDPREAAVGEARGARHRRGCISTNGSADARPSRGLMPGARHGVPLVADAAGVEPERKRVARSLRRSAGGSGATKRALRSGVKKPPSAKKRVSLGGIARAHRPLHRRRARRRRRRRCRRGRRDRSRARRRSRTPTARRARGTCRRPMR